MKANVLQLVGSFDQGGSERQAVQMTRLLRDGGRYHVHLAALRSEGVLREEVLRLGFSDIPEFPLRSFHDLNAMQQLRRFVRLLRERDIAIVQTYDFYTNVFGMAGAALAQVPVRIAARRETDGVRTGAQKWIERRAFNLSHVIVVNAEAVRRHLTRDGVSEQKIVTIYNGIDTMRIAPQPTFKRNEILAVHSLPIERHRRFVTIVANTRYEVKDHPMFLRAAALVYKEVPEAVFVIAGEGALRKSLLGLATDLGIEKNTFFIGRCERVGELLGISDVCVLSSKAEGFSNSILEYMAAARPVVATDVGGAAEAIVEGETGYLVPSGDAETMAARIISLLRDPNRARAMGERGREIVKQKFSSRAQLENTQAMYDRLIARTAGAEVEGSA